MLLTHEYFSDSRVLAEYTILKEVFKTTSVSNMSHAYAEFVLRRRVEYHITSTFLQESILINYEYESINNH